MLSHSGFPKGNQISSLSVSGFLPFPYRNGPRANYLLYHALFLPVLSPDLPDLLLMQGNHSGCKSHNANTAV